MLGALGATDRLREVLGADLLRVWMRGAGLGDDLAAGAGVDRARGCGRDWLPRPLNIPRSELGWAAALCPSDMLRVSSEARLPIAIDLSFPNLRHMARPPGRLNQVSFAKTHFSRHYGQQSPCPESSATIWQRPARRKVFVRNVLRCHALGSVITFCDTGSRHVLSSGLRQNQSDDTSRRLIELA